MRILSFHSFRKTKNKKKKRIKKKKREREKKKKKNKKKLKNSKEKKVSVFFLTVPNFNFRIPYRFNHLKLIKNRIENT